MKADLETLGIMRNEDEEMEEGTTMAFDLMDEEEGSERSSRESR